MLLPAPSQRPPTSLPGVALLPPVAAACSDLIYQVKYDFVSTATSLILNKGYAAACETHHLGNQLMDHKLHPIVRVDADLRSATVELHGCLTLPATTALVSILSKGRSLNPNLALRLDLSHARHIGRSQG